MNPNTSTVSRSIDFRVQVLRQLVRRAAEDRRTCVLVVTAGEDAARARRGHQTFGALEQVGPIVASRSKPNTSSSASASSSWQRRSAAVISLRSPASRRRVMPGSAGQRRARRAPRGGARDRRRRARRARPEVIGSSSRVDAVAHEHRLAPSSPRSRSPEVIGRRRCARRGTRDRDPSARAAGTGGLVRRASSRASQVTTGLVIARAHCATPVVLPLPAGPLTRVRRARATR